MLRTMNELSDSVHMVRKSNNHVINPLKACMYCTLSLVTSIKNILSLISMFLTVRTASTSMGQ